MIEPAYVRKCLNLLTDEELAQALDVTTATLQTWRCSGLGPPYAKLGKTVFYRLESVYTWIMDNEREPNGDKEEQAQQAADFRATDFRLN